MTKNDTLPYKIILVLDSSEREKTDLALMINGECFTVSSDTKAQSLPMLIEQLLAEKKLLPTNIDAIALVKKAGSVTAIRIGTAIANTLAWLVKAHIIEVAAEDIDTTIAKIRLGQIEKIVKVSQPSV